MAQKLGQHFLKNNLAIKKIIAALDLQGGDTVIEIGPGEGALTVPLVQACETVGCKVIAIEKDSALVQKLRGALAIKGNYLEIIEGDALKILTDSRFTLRDARFKIVGNIPYYITGKLLRVIGEMEQKPRLTTLMIQKEVAERLSAQPPKMNLLAAATQIWSEPEIIGYLKPEDFNPPPEVESAVVKLATRALPLATRELETYYRLIKAIFKQPRKTVLNNLSTGLDISKTEAVETLKKIGFSGSERPQNLSLEDLRKLSTLLNVN